MLGRTRCHVDRKEADLRHVVVEHAHLFVRELAKVDATFARDAQDVVIDVGDVAHAPHREAGVAEAAVEHVEDVIDERVAEVRRVVRRDAADVDADPSAPRLEGDHLLEGGVEQLHAGPILRRARRRPLATARPRARAARPRARTTLLLKLSRAFASSNPNHAASAISAGSGCSSASDGASTMK